MKRIVLFITAVLLFAGCAKEQLVEERSYTGPVTVVSATFESLSNGATKADVNDAGTFTWQNGDKAAFTAASGSSYYTGTNSSTSATANFTIYGAPTFTSSSFAFYPSDLTTGKSTSSLAVKVPTTREWVNGQTNVAMYGVKVENEASFNFSHMGGLVRVRVNNVPTNARKFVFKTPDYKISGDFTVEEESGYKVIKTKKHETENPVPEIEQTYTLTWTTAPDAENTMDFYIPLPLGTYANGFAFKFLDGTDAEILSKTSSQSETIARKDLVLMPAITLMGGEIEPAVKAAVVQEVPAGHSGDFLLANSEKVLLKVNASEQDKDITLKYNGGDLPTNLEIQVVGGKAFDKTISGDLPKTHVDFTTGEIAEVEMTTSSSTFAIIYPAKISTKLTVTGGNVKVEGAQVAAIEVAENAKADGGTAPVEIVVDKAEVQDFIAPVVTAKANVIVAPAASVEVKVTVEGEAKVANGGEGTVKDNNEQSIATKAAAKIGDIKYITLADAIAAVQNGQTITMIADVTDANGISVPSGKNFTVDFDNHKYLTEKPGAGSANTKTQAFQLLKGSTITFENGTIGCTEANKNHIWSSGDAVKGVAMIIQNYANLTLENMTINATNIAQNGDDKNVRYAVSTNHGSTTFSGTTTIITVGNDVAFDSCDSQNSVDEQNYPGKPTVTWDSEGTVTGGIELSGGNFVVKQNLAVDKPIVAIDDDNVDVSQSSLTVESGVTISTGANFEDLNPTLTNKHATGLVQVKRGAKLSVSGTGTIDAGDKSKTYSAAYVTVKGDNEAKTATLDVNGTTLKGYYYAIAGNGGRPNTVINLTDAKVYGTSTGDGDEAALGIYHPQMGTLTINGGSTEIKGKASGIEMRAGTLVVNDGKIEGTAVGYTVEANGSGSTTVGAGIAIAPHTTGKDISVTINGGEIKGNQAISNANPQNQTSEVAVTVNGGTFSDESAIKYAAQNANINIALQANRNASGIFLGQNKNVKVTFDLGEKTLNFVAPAVGSTGTENQAFHIEQGNQLFTLKNGKVTIDESAKTAFRFIIQNYNNLTVENVELDGSNLGFEDKTRYTVSNNQGTVNFTGSTSIKAASTNGIAFDVCKYASYDAPTVTWASSGSVTGEIELSGGTFVLGHNLAVKQPIKVIAPATLDLADYTLSAADGFTRPTAGVIIVNRKGDLTVKGNTEGAIDAKQVYAAVLMTEKTVDTQDTTNPAKLTVESGSLLGLNYGVVGNGSTGRGNTVITVTGGKIKGTSTESAGIYHPQNGTLTIAGGEIEGSTGIYVKSGDVITSVSAGTIKGTGAKNDYKPCTNGFQSTGDAIVFDNCGYPGGEPNAKISGGTFISTNAAQIGNYGYLPTYQPITIDYTGYQGTKPTERTNIE